MPPHLKACTAAACLLLLVLVVSVSAKRRLASSSTGFQDDANTIKAKANEYMSKGETNTLLTYLSQVERAYGTLLVDGELPSLYSYKGVALHNAFMIEDAEIAFQQAVHYFPNDTRAWINLGESRMQLFLLDAAIEAYAKAVELGDRMGLSRLLRVMGWSDSWRGWEHIVVEVERDAIICGQDVKRCTVDSGGGLEYTDSPGWVHRVLASFAPNAKSSDFLVDKKLVAALWPKEESSKSAKSATSLSTKEKGTSRDANSKRRLKVGIVSSDFGVHPVATLIRGAIDLMDRDRVELYCFSLHPKISWWGINVTRAAEHFVWLTNLNTQDAAAEIARQGIEVLIDLNGHTQNSGLRILAHRPAPVQLSFLGLPTTSGAAFIDYYLGDYVALTPELSNHFSESLLLMPPCYIANDYAQTQGDVPLYFSSHHHHRNQQQHQALRAPRSAISTDVSIASASMLFATFSNSQKVDPSIFQVWMNIMRRFSGSQMLFVDHKGASTATPHLREYAAHFGIDGSSRLVLAAQAPWIDHLYAKTAVDLILDTPCKNGHTTGLDGIWAGVPTLSMGGGSSMPARAAESMAEALGSQEGLAFSLKEYEDMAFRLIEGAKGQGRTTKRRSEMQKDQDKDKDEDEGETNREAVDVFAKGDALPASHRLAIWRKDVRAKRFTSKLFDTRFWVKGFVQQMQAAWEAKHVPFRSKGSIGSRDERKIPVKTHFNIFASSSQFDQEGHDSQRPLAMHQAYTDDSEIFSSLQGQKRRGDNIWTVAPSNSITTIPAFPTNTYTASFDQDDTNENGDGDGDGDVDGDDVDVEACLRKSFVAPPLPASISTRKIIMLNIGGMTAKEGWLIVNSQAATIPRPDGRGFVKLNVDILRQMHDLVGFANNSVAAIYASHILEHASFGDGYLTKTLDEWHRVLKPGGLLLVSVPDLTTLAQLYLSPDITLDEKWKVTRMMYGAQSDRYDFHKVGFDESLLKHFVSAAGFCSFERVGKFNLFDDTSTLIYKDRPISLNIAANKCSDQSGFRVDHAADEYEP